MQILSKATFVWTEEKRNFPSPSPFAPHIAQQGSHLTEIPLVLPTGIADLSGIEFLPDTQKRDQILGNFKLSNDVALSPRPSPSAHLCHPCFSFPQGPASSKLLVGHLLNESNPTLPQAISEAQLRWVNQIFYSFYVGYNLQKLVHFPFQTLSTSPICFPLVHSQSHLPKSSPVHANLSMSRRSG